MKKKRLKLDELKVKSFVTLEDDNASQTIKAGAAGSGGDELVPNPIKTILCPPTPGTWCYICPVDSPFER